MTPYSSLGKERMCSASSQASWGEEGSWALRDRKGKMITSHSSLRTHLADALEWAEKQFSGGNRIGKGIQGGRNCMYGARRLEVELAAGETGRG